MTHLIAERLGGVLSSFHERFGAFTVTIKQGDFHLGDERVNDDETAADPLAEALFRDGVQGFVMGEEMGQDELERWIEVLALAFRANSDEDVVTLLWDEAIPGLEVESYEGVGEAGAVAMAVTPDALAAELRRDGVTGDAFRGRRPPALPAEGPLVEALAATQGEDRVELTSRVAEVHAELLVYHAGRLTTDQATLLAEAPAAAYLEDGALAAARSWVGFLRAICDPTRLPDFPHRAAVTAALSGLCTPERVESFLSKVPGGPEADLAGVFDVLAGCGDAAIRRVERLQGRVAAVERREALGDLLVGLCRQRPERLVERFRNARDAEVALAVYGLFRHDPAFAVKEVQWRLRPGDAGAPAVIRALSDWPVAYTEAVREKVARLADHAPATRVAACRLWLMMDDTSSGPLLLAWAKDKWFRGLGQADQEPVLRALVALGGDPARELVQGMIEGRSLLRTTAEPTRIAAIRALGESEDPEVFRLLQRLQQGRDMALVGACRQAMAQINRRAERRTTTARTVTGRQPTTERPLAAAPPSEEDLPEAEEVEDPVLAREEMERRHRQAVAAQLVVQLSAALRSIRLYDADNEAVDRMVEALVRTLEQLSGRIEGDAALLAVEGIFFLGRERVRLPQQQIGVSTQLSEALADRGLGGIAFLDEPDTASIRGLCAALGREVGGTNEQRLEAYQLALREHGCTGIRLLPPMEVRAESEGAADRALRLAKAFVASVREMEAVREAGGRFEGLARLRRCAQTLVDACLADPVGARHLVGLLVPRLPEAGHAVRVAICALWLAARAGLPRPSLADLPLASLTRDVGREQLPEAERATDLEVHPLLGARDLLPPNFAQGRAQADVSALRRVLVAFEHHLGADGEGHPKLHSKQRVHPFSSLVRAAEDFDDLLRGRDGAALSPMEALLALRRNPPSTYPPGMIDALKALVSGVSKPGDHPTPIRSVQVSG